MFLLKKRYWVFIALLFTALLVLRTVPATWVVYGVQQAVPGFQVSGVSGSLWSGSATFSQWVDRGHTLSLGQLDWTLQPWSLLLLTPCIVFSTEIPQPSSVQQSIKGMACYSLLGGEAILKNVDITLPIAKISPYFNMNLEGQIDAHVKQAALKQDRTLGTTSGHLSWQRAALYNGSQWVSLGHIQGQFRDDQGGLSSQWAEAEQSSNIAAPIEIDLDVVVSNLAAAQPSINVKGFVKPSAESTAIIPMLRFIGEATNDGRYQIELNE